MTSRISVEDIVTKDPNIFSPVIFSDVAVVVSEQESNCRRRSVELIDP